MPQRLLLNAHQMDILLNRLTCQLIENHFDFSETVLIGLQPRGYFVLDRLLNLFSTRYNIDTVISGKLDTTFFRDDFRRGNKLHEAKPTQMNVEIENKAIVLIDDVLYTGRSIRAALTAIESYGRPSKIELLSFVDRRFSRHLPIQPDYVGIQIDSLQNDKVKVNWEEITNEDAVYLIKDTI